MQQRTGGIVAGAGLAAGIAIGIAVGAWATADVSAQLGRGKRFEVEREAEFMFIRDTRMNSCYFAVVGGGILQVQCPL